MCPKYHIFCSQLALYLPQIPLYLPQIPLHFFKNTTITQKYCCSRHNRPLYLKIFVWQTESSAQRTNVKSHCGGRASSPTLPQCQLGDCQVHLGALSSQVLLSLGCASALENLTAKCTSCSFNSKSSLVQFQVGLVSLHSTRPTWKWTYPDLSKSQWSRPPSTVWHNLKLYNIWIPIIQKGWIQIYIGETSNYKRARKSKDYFRNQIIQMGRKKIINRPGVAGAVL
jgi:hypothetical protein